MKENEETLSVQPGDEVVVKARVEEEDGSSLLFVCRGSECGWIRVCTMQVRLLNWTVSKSSTS